MKMNKNVGVADLIIRVVMGVSLVIAGIIIVKGTAGLIFVALSIRFWPQRSLAYVRGAHYWDCPQKKKTIAVRKT